MQKSQEKYSMRIRAIIPAAGFGTRVGMKFDESKEMLLDPITNTPVIQWYLNICERFNLDPLVITRKEKTDLITFLNHKNIDTIILDEIKGEWPDTILASENKWYKHNILFLPDTRFDPIKIIKDIKKQIKIKKCVMALHQVDNISKWGAVHYGRHIIQYQEKPQDYTFEGTAWGILAFNKDFGRTLFENMKDRTRWHTDYLDQFGIIQLNWFKDITRNGKVEKY